MGSEHSTQGQQGPQGVRPTSFDDSAIPRGILSRDLRRQHTIANPGGTVATFTHPEEIERPGSTSPGPSVCSDTDLPYISYTVNRPIGGEKIITTLRVGSNLLITQECKMVH